jgi:hypothetical protein
MLEMHDGGIMVRFPVEITDFIQSINIEAGCNVQPASYSTENGGFHTGYKAPRV